MIDTRDSYRAVGPLNADEKYFRLEIRKWWSPFWNYIGLVDDHNEGRERAKKHAHKYARLVVKLGRFPERGEI